MKAFSLEYCFPGELMVGWEAHHISGDEYNMIREDGLKRHISLHREIMTLEGKVVPYKDDSGVLRFGDKSVVIGKDINHEFHARKKQERGQGAGKKQVYLIMQNNPLRNIGELELGQEVDGKPLALVDSHILQYGERKIVVYPKMKETVLLVMNKPLHGGFLAYINVKDEQEGYSWRDGGGAPAGALIRPANPGEPARYVEEIAGEILDTARFWPEGSRSMVRYEFRSPKDAMTEQKLTQQLEKTAEIALRAGIEPEDYFEHEEIVTRLKELEKRWVKGQMGCTVGREFFFPETSPSPSLGR